jgi:MFS family permease
MENERSVKFSLTDRQKKILPVLMCGSFFEGFDWMVINMALPFIAKDMHIGVESTGLALSIVAVGTLAAFFLVRMGDRIGRRPVFIWSVCLYGIMSICTAFSPNIVYFVTCQFLARVFLVSEWATGLIVISEEFPVETRGRGLALFQGISGVGAIFPSLLMPVMAATPFGWRGLFVIGGLPLIAILILKKNFTETQRFQRTAKAAAAKPDFFEVFKPEYRGKLFSVSCLWFLAYLCYMTAMTFFSYYAVNERAWTAARVGLTTSVAYVIGFAGFFLAGKMMDSIGRKKTAVLFFLGGSVSLVGVFELTGYVWIFIALISCTFFISVFTVICASFTNELFPTRVRATATAWGNNIFGRLAQIMTPTVVGFLAAPLGGTGHAASLMAIGPVLASIVVITMLPETREHEIQDIDE